jgi:hypothetical protein
MKKLGLLIEKGYGSERCRWCFAFLAALALIAFAATTRTITFFDNDDLNIAWALAGYRGGTPSFAHPFINCIMAFFVSGLYTILPQLPWWLIVQLFAVMLGMAAVFAALLKTGHRNAVPLPLVLALMIAFGAGLYFYGIVLVTFTLSSTIIGAGAAALVLAMDKADGTNVQRRYLSLSVILLAGSMLVRNSSGLAAACFVGGALVYRAVKAGKDGERALMKRMVHFLSIAAAVTVVLAGVNAIGRSTQNPEGFVDYDEARSSVMDYPHDGFGENTELYASVGWDGTLYSLVSSWFYMDERVTTDAFNTIVQGSKFANMGVGERISYGWGTLTTFLGNYPLAVLIGGITAASWLAALGLFVCNRRRVLAFAAASAFLLGAGFLTAYLCYAGRMNLRVWMSVCIPAASAIWLSALTLYRRDRQEGKKPAARIIPGLVVGLAAIVSLGFGYKVFRTVMSYESDGMLLSSRAVVQYALDHPENVYVRDVYAANNVDALSVYPDEKPTNLMDWGGCDMNTAAREAQLAVNGLSSAYAADLFRRDNVYYIGDLNDGYAEVFFTYMTEDCGATGYEAVSTIIDNIVVVRFVFEAEK